MVVAIAEIGVQTGRLTREVSTAVVGAGLLSVRLFPPAANALLARDRRTVSAMEQANAIS